MEKVTERVYLVKRNTNKLNVHEEKVILVHRID